MFSEDTKHVAKFRASYGGGLLQHVSTLNMGRLMQTILFKGTELTKPEQRLGDHVMSDISGNKLF